MSASRKPNMGTSRAIGTSRLPPLPGSRGGTPSTSTSSGNRASASTSTSTTQQQPQQQQQNNMMKQNLLDKDRKMAEYSVSSWLSLILFCSVLIQCRTSFVVIHSHRQINALYAFRIDISIHHYVYSFRNAIIRCKLSACPV